MSGSLSFHRFRLMTVSFRLPFSLPPPTKAPKADVKMEEEEKKIEAEVSMKEAENGKNPALEAEKVQKPSFKRRNQAIYTAEEHDDN